MKDIFTIRWKPNQGLVVAAVCWLLLVSSSFLSTMLFGAGAGEENESVLLFSMVSAMLCGVGLPLYWLVMRQHRPLADLGLTPKWVKRSHFLQLIFVVLQFAGIVGSTQFPSFEKLFPLIIMAQSIGFFEAFFWRGCVQMRIEESFGIIPAILLSAALYAVTPIPYGRQPTEMLPLFLTAVMYAVIFRLTRNVLILWPISQPMRLLVVFLSAGLAPTLPSALGFFGISMSMLALIYLSGKYYKTQSWSKAAA